MGNERVGRRWSGLKKGFDGKGTFVDVEAWGGEGGRLKWVEAEKMDK